jgi:rfaE bifunctional protein kinase chain/domain
MIKPNFYVKGADYKNNKFDDTRKIYLEKKTVENYGGKIKYTNEQAFSSSKIINQKNLLYTEEQQKFLDTVKKKFNYKKFTEELNLKKKINITIIGEIIFDIYNFGDVVGKSGKEPHLVMSNKNSETIIGGSAAIARNLATFVDKINLISSFGFEKKYQNLLNKQMPKNIKKIFCKPYKSFKSISKTRFVDISSNYKLFGSYDIPKKNELQYSKEFINKIKKIISKSDLIIISDYGHGFLNGKILNIINSTKIFKTLNAQINSSSMGFANITKYSKINSLIINETELRQQLKDQSSNIIFLSKKLINEGKFDTLIVTSGKKGATIFTKKNKNYISCPAFSDFALDKIGAGDSMLSISSFAIYCKFNHDLSLLMGSIAAASTVKSIGNKKIIDKNYILRTLKYMLK